jgi:Rab proteins geranylgeranyltransferase component A
MTESLDKVLSLPEYNLPHHLQEIIKYAIAMTPTPNIGASTALHAIRRHLRSFGIYGVFPLLVPMHGGGGEIAQAFCRSAAVKGATYILGRRISQINETTELEWRVKVDFSDVEELPFVHAKRLVRLSPVIESDCVEICRSAVVVEGVFEGLFATEAVHKEAALIVVPPGTLGDEQEMPIQMVIHGGGIGECPIGQCILPHFEANDRDCVF